MNFRRSARPNGSSNKPYTPSLARHQAAMPAIAGKSCAVFSKGNDTFDDPP
jgi:hypothetical protein